MRNELIKKIGELVSSAGGERVVFMTGDLGFSVLEPLQEKMKARFVNVGIAEALMASSAAAIASDGFKVFVYSIIPFTTFRCLEQIRNDICYHNVDVTVVGVGAGFSYGPLGPTHHSTEDLGALWSLPNMKVFSPADIVELRLSIEYSLTQPGPKYLRLGKGGEGELSQNKFESLGREDVLRYREGDSLTLITSGPILSEVLAAADVLIAHGWKVEVLSCPVLKPFPTESLLKFVSSTKILIVEEFNSYCGFGFRCKSAMLSQNPSATIHIMSAPDKFADVVGDQKALRAWAELDTDSIVARANRLLGQLRRVA